MIIGSKLVNEVNGAHGKLALNAERVEELAIELNQLASAIEKVRERLSFDGEPSGFRSTLLNISRDPADA